MKCLLLYLIFIQTEFTRALYSYHEIVNSRSDIQNNKDWETSIDTYHMTTTKNGFCVKRNGDIRYKA